MKINLAGCVIANNNEILLLHRIKNGQYELPGGKIDEGEDPKSAAIRELKEELCVDVEILRHLGEKDFQENGYSMSYTWFLGRIKEDQIPTIGEPEKFDGYKYIELIDLANHPLSQNMLNLLEEIKSGRVTL